MASQIEQLPQTVAREALKALKDKSCAPGVRAQLLQVLAAVAPAVNPNDEVTDLDTQAAERLAERAKGALEQELESVLALIEDWRRERDEWMNSKEEAASVGADEPPRA